MKCNIHPSEDAIFYLEAYNSSELQADCYNFCKLVELKALVNYVAEQDQLPPCGCDGSTPTWFEAIGYKDE